MPRLSKIGAAALAAFGWTSGVSGVTADFLVIAGGGGGGFNRGGGGGGGGYRTSAGTSGGGGSAEAKLSLNPLLSYAVTVGAGGAGSTTDASAGTNGSDSVFSTITSTGGGGGGSGTPANGVSGGSGGGARNAASATGGAGTANQGYAGGNNTSNDGGTGGGGGGAGSVGKNGNPETVNRGYGGSGVASSISGSSVTNAGGGGAGGNATQALGQNGGGNGSYSTIAGTAGTANTGGGGGGGNNLTTFPGTAGGSGIVIISYAGAQQFGGGVVTSSGGNTIHTFTTSGTLVPITPLSASYLIVAGGGGAGFGRGGGGGAGGLLTGSALTIDPYSTYVVTVGAGGIGGTSGLKGSNGTNSAFSMVSTAAVGGGGGAFANGNGNAGGSGGGCQGEGQTGGAGTSGQGFAGGNFLTPSGAGTNYVAGGGGGAGAVGANGHTNYTSGVGNGGIGVASSISGTFTYYAGGGGGGANSGGAGTGGTGGGGNGAFSGSGTVGTINSGGGGGGSDSSSAGMAGGSGIVIISYAGATQLMAGGTVTISGGNVIHTFTSSGYLTPIKYVNNSLRFRSSASAYLNRTFKTPTSQQKGTFSFWLKRGALGARNNLFSNDNGTQYGFLEFDANNKLNFADPYSAGACSLVTTQVFRDPAAWYHIVIAFDTTQATSTDRAKFYVNGVQITSFDTATYPSQNANLYMLQAGSAVQIAAFTRNGTPTLDGYLTEYNFIDGQALTPNSFGTFNSYGVWQPITYGGSYGINGFYLPFTNTTSTTTLGYDFSPNGNNWTTNNISLTAGATYDSMTDVPTLTSATAANYCVLNPLQLPTIASTVLSNANLLLTCNSGNSYNSFANGTMYPTSGKYYAEFYVNTVGETYVGISRFTDASTPNSWNSQSTYYNKGGVIQKDNATIFSVATYTTGDTIGVAYDVDNATCAFYKNNTLVGTVTGVTAGLYTFSIAGYFSAAISFNTGQRPFTYTPPSGFVGLNTFNL